MPSPKKCLKNTTRECQKNATRMPKINILTYPSLWLEVFYKAKESTSQPTNQETSRNQPTNQQTNNRRNPTTNQSPSTRSYPTSTPVSWGNKQGHLSTTLDTAPGSWPQLTGCFDSESLVIPHMFRCLATTWTLTPLDCVALLIHKTGFIVARIGMTCQVPSYAHSKLGSLVW